ncbi:Glutamate receptor [Melia azedarach]|uniref:Glutamate receptor n=1 Tax=Melia azedarach TaxID=155640 RepID=A0ACC1WY67_MELAZ|nr:Glutamate receptor [Melia azedarach]
MANTIAEQIRCTAALGGAYNWRKVIMIYEDNANSVDTGNLSLLSENLQITGSEIDHRLVLPPFSYLTNPKQVVQEELEKLLRTESRVFITLQLSLPMAIHLFRQAKEIGHGGRLNLVIEKDKNSIKVGDVGTGLAGAAIWPGDLKRDPKGRAMPTDAKPFIVGVPARTTFHKFVKVIYSNNPQQIQYDGFCGDLCYKVLQVLEYALPYEFVIHHGTYDDLVYNKNYDAVIGDVAILVNRKNSWNLLNQIQSQGNWHHFDLYDVRGLIPGAQMELRIQWPWNSQIGTALWFNFSSLFFSHRERVYSNLTRLVVIVWLFVVFYLKLKLYCQPFFNAHSAEAETKSLMFRYKEYSATKPTYRFGGFGFVFQKGSPLAVEFSEAILKLSENGELKSLEEKWFAPSPECSGSADVTDNETESLSLHNFWVLYIVSGITSTICVLLFLVKNYGHHQDSSEGNITSSARSLWSRVVESAKYICNSREKKIPGRD